MLPISFVAAAAFTFAAPPHGTLSLQRPCQCRGVMVTDFSGEWQMDLASSEKLGPVLRELGVPRVLAAVVTRLGVRQDIAQSDTAVTITCTTALSTDTLELQVDGSASTLPGIVGGATAAVTRWRDESRLETRQCLTADESAAALDTDYFVTTRFLEDGMLIEDCAIVRAGRAVQGATAQRRLRRVA